MVKEKEGGESAFGSSRARLKGWKWTNKSKEWWNRIMEIRERKYKMKFIEENKNKRQMVEEEESFLKKVMI